MFSKLSSIRIINRWIGIKNGVKSLSTTSQSSHQPEPDINRAKLSYHSNPPGNFYLVGQTIQERLNLIAASKPNDVVYKFMATKTVFTFGELKQRVDELAQGYMQLGLSKGDRVALMLPNTPELVLSLYALSQIGCIAVLMNPVYNMDEIEFMLKKTKSKALVILKNFKTIKQYDILSRICPELSGSSRGELKSSRLPDLSHVIMANNGLTDDEQKYAGTWSFEHDIAKFSRASRPTPKLDFDDPVFILFTSGTTGFPKAAPLTHFAVVNSARNCVTFPGNFESERILCCPIPIFHLFALIVCTVSAVVNGTRTIYPFPFPDTLSSLKAIESERCTSIKGPPTILFDLIHHPDLAKHDVSSLESILVGASVVPKDLLLKIKSSLNLKSAIIGFAMTESGCTGTQTRVLDMQKSDAHAYETIGTMQPFVEAKVIDPNTGEMVERGVDGEICIRSFGVIKGFWEDPEKTREAIDPAGWYRTGDIGSMTNDGYLVYKTRAKEMIIRGGVNVYPAEIERVLRTHPAVLDACVYGLPDQRLGEEIGVWVKLRPRDHTTSEKLLTENALKEWAKERIAAFKIPRYIKFVDAFPVSATGKIQKFKITQQMCDELKLNAKK